MPLKIEPSNVHLTDRAIEYLKRNVLYHNDISNPTNLKLFPTIGFSLASLWTDPDGVKRSRGPHYGLGKLDISKLSKGYVLRLDKHRFVAFLPEEFVPEPEDYSIDVADGEIVVHTC